MPAGKNFSMNRALRIACFGALAGIAAAIAATEELPRAGDYKGNYESPDYKTSSLSVEERKGKPADLYQLSHNPPKGLPAVSIPDDNPQTREGILLGRRLFFDRRLSLNNTMSCAICHVPEMGFANNEMKTPVGFEGRTVKRNAPTVLNAAYKTRMFHDGRETSLENQVWSPLLAGNEMANPSIGYVIEKIQAIDEYKGLFEKAFAGRGATMETIAKALAQYQRSLLAGNSRFDRWYYGKDESALNAEEQLGFAVFAGKGACAACHTIGPEHALFTDNKLHNTGLGYEISMKKETPTERVQLAPGIFVDVRREFIKEVTRVGAAQNDLGAYEVTQDPADRWKFATPTLRNVELTAPYMHNGSMSTLEEVIEFYDRGGVANELLSPLIKPLGLSIKEKEALHAFLLTLTAGNYTELVLDGFAAPVGELDANDPFWSNRRKPGQISP